MNVILDTWEPVIFTFRLDYMRRWRTTVHENRV